MEGLYINMVNTSKNIEYIFINFHVSLPSNGYAKPFPKKPSPKNPKK